LQGQHNTDVKMLEGKIRNSRIIQSIATVIGTEIGSMFGGHKL